MNCSKCSGTVELKVIAIVQVHWQAKIWGPRGNWKRSIWTLKTTFDTHSIGYNKKKHFICSNICSALVCQLAVTVKISEDATLFTWLEIENILAECILCVLSFLHILLASWQVLQNRYIFQNSLLCVPVIQLLFMHCGRFWVKKTWARWCHGWTKMVMAPSTTKSFYSTTNHHKYCST